MKKHMFDRKIVREWLARPKGLEHIDEGVVHVPSEFIDYEAAEDFIAQMDPDDTVDEYVIDGATGEILMEPGERAGDCEAHPQKKKEMIAKQNAELEKVDKWIDKFKFDDPYHYIAGGWMHPYEYVGQFEQLYDVETVYLYDDVDDPDMMIAGDYDVYYDAPSRITRKDGKDLSKQDMKNIDEYIKMLYKDDAVPYGIKLDVFEGESPAEARVDYTFV